MLKYIGVNSLTLCPMARHQLKPWSSSQGNTCQDKQALAAREMMPGLWTEHRPWQAWRPAICPCSLTPPWSGVYMGLAMRSWRMGDKTPREGHRDGWAQVWSWTKEKVPQRLWGEPYSMALPPHPASLGQPSSDSQPA